ncbi:MAG: hypothetical protein PHD73_07875 [Sediminibacterium sp.]|nr:hypothetical protein [Sediminibacterium sp.]
MNNSELRKTEWTEKDFEQMVWHDCKIHAIAFGMNEYELAFDIDYILSWMTPHENSKSFRFSVSPATLIFKNVYELSCDIPSVDIAIDSIERANPVKPKNAAYIGDHLEYDWVITTSNGDISFKAVGYVQYLRQAPIETNTQSLSLLERGGISFSNTPY